MHPVAPCRCPTRAAGPDHRGDDQCLVRRDPQRLRPVDDVLLIRHPFHQRDHPLDHLLAVAGVFPDRAVLDAAFPDRPVWLRRIDGHAGWANTKALEIAGIDAETPDPVGGKIIRDAGPMNAGTTIIAFVEDPDGYQIELLGPKS